MFKKRAVMFYRGLKLQIREENISIPEKQAMPY